MHFDRDNLPKNIVADVSDIINHRIKRHMPTLATNTYFR